MEEDLILNIVFINFLLMIVLYVINYFVIVLSKNQTNLIDIEKTSASDYTLMISNLPSHCSNVEELKSFIIFVFVNLK